MISEIKLAEMLCTRLCHDLTGPIGAVNNGAEFLSDEGFDMQNEAVQLILSSAREAVNRLQFYRQAYGRVSDSGEACLADKKQLAENFFSGSKISLDWPDMHTDAAGVSISQKMSRIILNLFVVCGGALIRGGTISVRLGAKDKGDKQVTITASGDTVKLDADIASILRGGADESLLSPKTAQSFLIRKLADEVDAGLDFELHGEKLEITVSQHRLAVAAAS